MSLKKIRYKYRGEVLPLPSPLPRIRRGENRRGRVSLSGPDTPSGRMSQTQTPEPRLEPSQEVRGRRVGGHIYQVPV